MLIVKCIKDFTEVTANGTVLKCMKGMNYHVRLNGYFTVEVGDLDLVIRNRSKFYKHFIIIC